MPSYQVDAMHCGHCARAIQQAVQSADPAARVDVDLAQKRVHVEPAGATDEAIRAALAQAGYPTVPVAAQPAKAEARCCCAGGG